MENTQLIEQLEIIGNAIDRIDTPHSISIDFDTETFNMLAFSLSELAENTKRIASALERMEEA